MLRLYKASVDLIRREISIFGEDWDRLKDIGS